MIWNLLFMISKRAIKFTETANSKTSGKAYLLYYMIKRKTKICLPLNMAYKQGEI